jgi:hypothetical protein
MAIIITIKALTIILDLVVILYLVDHESKLG